MIIIENVLQIIAALGVLLLSTYIFGLAKAYQRYGLSMETKLTYFVGCLWATGAIWWIIQILRG